MTFYVENEIHAQFPFDYEAVAQNAITKALEHLECPYEVEINLTITDKATIKQLNASYRDIDKETDVLSFPSVDYDAPADFSYVEADPSSYLNVDTDELMLGDIILCYERILEQAEEYGHSVLREYAFLIVHSVLHLCGFDHMTKADEQEMFTHQNQIMTEIDILR